MTQTPQPGRNRRVNRTAKPESVAPVSQPRSPQLRQPIGRSQELQARDAQLRQQAQDARARAFSDFERRDYSARAAAPRRRKKRRDGHTALWAMVSVVCIVATLVLLMFAAPQLLGIQYASMPNFVFVNGSIVRLEEESVQKLASYRQALQTDRIFGGVYIDGVYVGGMTAQEAYDAVNAVPGGAGGEFAITINVGGNVWSVDSDSIPLYRSTQEAVMQAWAVGRTNTTAIRGTTTTPFRQRLSTVQDALNNARVFYTTTTYDRNAVRALVDSIAAAINRDPVNASVATFDPNTKTFTFHSDENGLFIDADAIYDAVVTRLDNGYYYDSLYVEPAVLLADTTKAELMNSFGLISKFTTETTSSANRNTNIRLSAETITNQTVLPGETFSFNQATGQRTEAKGYKPAAAIAGGETFDEIGGGVCQTSSTLFNAVARANLTIVERDPHAWPSNYVPKGEDATVNWPNLDFRFRNDTQWPIFIVANYANRKVTVEIYGMTLGEGVTIDLESKVTYTKEPPAEPKYVYDASLAVGKEEVSVKARTGYTVETYKVWYKNGQEFKREKLHTSHYQMYQKTIKYNDGYGYDNRN